MCAWLWSHLFNVCMTMIPSLWCVHDYDPNCLMCAWPWSQLFDVLQLPTSGYGPTETHSDALVALPPTLYNGTSNPSCTHVTNATDVIRDVTTRRWMRHEVFEWCALTSALNWEREEGKLSFSLKLSEETTEYFCCCSLNRSRFTSVYSAWDFRLKLACKTCV